MNMCLYSCVNVYSTRNSKDCAAATAKKKESILRTPVKSEHICTQVNRQIIISPLQKECNKKAEGWNQPLIACWAAQFLMHHKRHLMTLRHQSKNPFGDECHLRSSCDPVGYSKGAPDPKHHGQAMRSAMKAEWIKSQTSEMDGLWRRGVFQTMM